MNLQQEIDIDRSGKPAINTNVIHLITVAVVWMCPALESLLQTVHFARPPQKKLDLWGSCKGPSMLVGTTSSGESLEKYYDIYLT